jgi:TP901 family phage tail tape measure protein
MANNTIEADVRSLIGAIETLTNRVTDLEGKVKQTNATGRQSKTTADKLAEANRKLNASMTAEGKELMKVNALLRQQQAAANKAAKEQLNLDKETRKYTRTLSNSEKVMNQFRGMMLQTFGAYAIIRGIRNTVNTIKEFESNMARVRAITGATDEEFKRLSDIARDMAKKGSIFSPATIAELQIELSKLGFTASEISVATEPIVALATATGEDLAKAAEIAAATLRSFQLDASEMGRTIDVMAKSFTTSALDMSRWAEGAKYAAPVANALGWSVEDLGSIMAVLANRQIFGSLAGTSLRNIMIELNNESSTLYKTLELTDNSFEGFIEALGRANEEGLGTTEMLEMIPRRALTAFTVLASSTKEVQRMRVALEDASGAVNEMAEIQLQTLASRLAITQNAWESLVVSIDEGSGVISTSIKGAADWVTELITRLNLINDYDLDFWKNIFGVSFLPTFEVI